MRRPRTLFLLPLVGLALIVPRIASASGPVFSDDFESGGLGAWSSTSTTPPAVQQTSVHAGVDAAEVAVSGTRAFATATFDAAQPQLYYRMWFRVEGHSTPITLGRFLNPSSTSILRFGLTKTGKLFLGNDTNKAVARSLTGVTDDAWHELQVHLLIGGANGRADAWLDGVPIADLGGVRDYGSAGVQSIQFGEPKNGRSSDVVYDDIATDLAFVGSTDTTSPDPGPAAVGATTPTPTRVDLSWTEAADDVGVAGYTVYRDGAEIGISGGASYVDVSASPNTSYTYTVDAFDFANNHSVLSDPPLQVTTPQRDPVIDAAGDIACDPADPDFNHLDGTATHCAMKATEQAIATDAPDAVLALGDLQYDCAGYQAFLQSYDLTWGLLNDVTHPGPGNQEYDNAGGTGCSAHHDGSGYFKYWGDWATGAGVSTPADPLGNAKGYYSVDIGDWHIISLNSECGYVSCSKGSAQEVWLQHDLATHANMCTLAFWHRPTFGPDSGYDNSSTLPFWKDLYAEGADVILHGHAHLYQRFAPQTPTRQADAVHGIREFIVGTGGERLSPIDHSSAPRSVVLNDTTFGILRMTLHPTSYDWEFVPVNNGTFTDSGHGDCH